MTAPNQSQLWTVTSAFVAVPCLRALFLYHRTTVREADSEKSLAIRRRQKERFLIMRVRERKGKEDQKEMGKTAKKDGKSADASSFSD